MLSTRLTPEEVKALTPLLASRFIQRRDPVAQQNFNGGYRPLRDEHNVPDIQFDRQSIGDHLRGTKTYGHYLLDTEDNAKLMVFDVDLQKGGFIPMVELEYAEDEDTTNEREWLDSFTWEPDLREAWRSKKAEYKPAKQYIKRQLRELGGMFAASINKRLEIDTAVAYTGNKGIHIYGFTGKLPAEAIRNLAFYVLDDFPWLEPSRGDNFYTDVREFGNLNDEVFRYYHNFHIEVYPKQDSLAGKDLGNLVRLPLGKNLHNPTHPTFFVDLTSPLNELRPVEPVFALTTSNPWQTPEEAS